MTIEEILKSKDGWFKTAFRGYKPADVDRFFQEVTRYCYELIEEKRKLEEELFAYREREDFIQNAEMLAMEMKSRAESEAQSIREEAKKEVEQLSLFAKQKPRETFKKRCLFDMINTHCKNLIEQKRKLKEELTTYREQEAYIHAAMIKAEEVAAKTISEAEKAASKTISGAEDEGKKILDTAGQEALKITRDARQSALGMIEEAGQYKQRVEELLHKHKQDGERLLNKFYEYLSRHINSLKDEFIQEIAGAASGLDKSYTAVSKPYIVREPAGGGLLAQPEEGNKTRPEESKEQQLEKLPVSVYTAKKGGAA